MGVTIGRNLEFGCGGADGKRSVCDVRAVDEQVGFRAVDEDGERVPGVGSEWG